MVYNIKSPERPNFWGGGWVHGEGRYGDLQEKATNPEGSKLRKTVHYVHSISSERSAGSEHKRQAQDYY